jgi:FixJ family two-component response regulator
MQAGAMAFLRKPVSQQALISAIGIAARPSGRECQEEGGGARDKRYALHDLQSELVAMIKSYDKLGSA